MEPLITLDINKFIDQLCAANCTNGQLTSEVERLATKNEELARENHALREKLSSIKGELEAQKALWEYSYTEKEKYKNLYENLAKTTEGV